VRTENRYLGPVGNGSTGVSPDGSAPVITTPVPDFEATHIEEAFDGLLARLPEGGTWQHGWQPGRTGPSRVERQPTIDSFVRQLGMRRTAGTRGAFYNPQSDVVNVPPEKCFLDDEEETATEGYYSTLLHELVHWTGHISRLKRFPEYIVTFTREQYAREELVAEATAIILMRHFNVTPKTLSRHATYFQNWLKRAGDREEALAYAMREAGRAARFLLTVNTTIGRDAGGAA
jgi:antirestriction protein ArdC